MAIDIQPRFLAAVLIAGGALFGGSAPASAQDQPSVRVTRCEGNVEVRKSGAQAWRPAKDGETIERGDRVAARDKSTALLLWSNGSMVKIHSNAETTLTGVSFDLEKKMETTVLDLHDGRVFVKAQVPDHLFTDFKVRIGAIEVRTQGAEFALTHDPDRKSVTAWALLGTLYTDAGAIRVRIDGGQQATVVAGSPPGARDVKPIEQSIRQSLARVSMDLGGGLLVDEAVGAAGGKLAAKIGGVISRRGNAPYKVNFKALIAGGSGKLKSYSWDFGDGESAAGRDAEHTFTQGMYVVILRVEDENGQKASAQTGISVEVDCGC